MRYLLLTLMGLVLSGCNQGADISDLQDFTEMAFRDHIPEVDPLPALLPLAVFIYTASGLPDPFDTENLKEQVKDLPGVNDESGPDRSRRKEPLEAFPIDGLKLVGILAQHGEQWAVVRAPDKSVHRVRQGNYMGVNNGEIIAVNDSDVYVTELVKNPVGRWEEKEAKLILVE
jgi:type IV pilus assembly protein PilP